MVACPLLLDATRQRPSAQDHLRRDARDGPTRCPGLLPLRPQRCTQRRSLVGRCCLSDIEARCVCAGCGNRGAQVRPDFSTGKPPQFARSSARWRNERAEEKLQVLLALFFELAERPRHQPSSPQAGVVSQCASFRCQHIPDSFRPPPFHLPN